MPWRCLYLLVFAGLPILDPIARADERAARGGCPPGLHLDVRDGVRERLPEPDSARELLQCPLVRDDEKYRQVPRVTGTWQESRGSLV